MVLSLDAGPMLAYLKGEPDAPTVEALLDDPASLCFAHSVNVIEVYYDFLRSSGEGRADAALVDLIRSGVIVREDMDPEFCQTVARLKARGRIALADCFCIALAQRIGGEAVTTDHRGFDPLVPLGLCPIRFIR